MIPISEIASLLNPAPKGRRYLAVYRFFSDESYDADPNAPNAIPMPDPGTPYIPATYVVAGFFAEEATWTEVERRWKRENERVGVTRYHAANVNNRDGEFNGWSVPERDTYAKNLLAIIRDQGMGLHAVACGMFPREYEQLINEHGRTAFGSPHIACFKTMVAVIAQEMANRHFEARDKFAVIFDHRDTDYDCEVSNSFLRMKFHPDYPFGERLATCDPGTWQEYVALQPADLIAYETFKALHAVHRSGDVKARKSLESLFDANGFMGYYLDRETIQMIRPRLEAANCDPGAFVLQLALRTDIGYGIPLP